jgi:hypothetical protein
LYSGALFDWLLCKLFQLVADLFAEGFEIADGATESKGYKPAGLIRRWRDGPQDFSIILCRGILATDLRKNNRGGRAVQTFPHEALHISELRLVEKNQAAI